MHRCRIATAAAAFRDALRQALQATILKRYTDGQDIHGGCGRLAGLTGGQKEPSGNAAQGPPFSPGSIPRRPTQLSSPSSFPFSSSTCRYRLPSMQVRNHSRQRPRHRNRTRSRTRHLVGPHARPRHRINNDRPVPPSTPHQPHDPHLPAPHFVVSPRLVCTREIHQE